MLDYVIFTVLSPANGASRASSLGSTQQAGLLIGEEEQVFFFLSQELQKYSGEGKKLAAIITIHRLQEKAKTGRQLLMEGKKKSAIMSHK